MTGLLINDEMENIWNEGLTTLTNKGKCGKSQKPQTADIRGEIQTAHLQKKSERPAATPNRSVLPGMPQTTRTSFSTNNRHCSIKR